MSPSSPSLRNALVASQALEIARLRAENERLAGDLAEERAAVAQAENDLAACKRALVAISDALTLIPRATADRLTP